MSKKIIKPTCKPVKASSWYDEEDEVDKQYDANDAWQLLLDEGVSEETLQVVTDINGFSVETLDDVCYSKFGMHLDQL